MSKKPGIIFAFEVYVKYLAFSPGVMHSTPRKRHWRMNHIDYVIKILTIGATLVSIMVFIVFQFML